MTQANPTPQTPPTPEGDLASAASLANAQDISLTLVFGVTTAGNTDVRRVALSEAVADSLRPRASQWIAAVAGKLPIAYEPGYSPDATEVAFITNSGNAIALDMNAKLFPPASIPVVQESGFLLHADFLALIAIRGNRRAVLVKRITASKVILRPDRKVFGLLSNNATLTAVESPVVELDHSYDALVSPAHTFMPSLDVSERIFGLEAEIIAKQSANVQAIAAILPVSDQAALARICGNTRIFRKKLHSVIQRGVFNRPIEELRAFIEAEQLSLQFIEIDGSPHLVVQETSDWLRDFLRFLDEDFMTGGITSTKYIANSKRKRGA